MMSEVIVYVDAAKNTVSRVVNSYGKINTFDNGGFRIGVVCEGRNARYVNTKAEDSFAAETYALFKGLEFALEVRPDVKIVVIRSDCQQAGAITKNEQANTYVRVLEKTARERGVTIRHEFVSGSENPADRVSRTEADPETPPFEKPSVAPLVGKVSADDILPDELDQYEAINNSDRSSASKGKKRNALRDRIAARLGVAHADAHPLGLGHVIREAFQARVDARRKAASAGDAT